MDATSRNSLATCCPACDTVFGISRDQTRLRGGMVRCGVCQHAFNALDHLVEWQDEAPQSQHQLQSSDDMPLELAITITDVPDVPADVPADESAPVAEPDAGAIDSIDASGAALPESSSTPSAALAQASFLTDGRARRPSRLIFGLLSLVGAVALIAQAVWMWRDDLAANVPALKPALEQACLALDCRVEAPMHITEITIESSELQAQPPARDTYAFVALLRNHSFNALRYPDLELTLVDALEQPVLRRVLKPAEYLGPAQRARIGDGLAGNAELPLRVLFVSTQKASGYRAAVFYP